MVVRRYQVGKGHRGTRLGEALVRAVPGLSDERASRLLREGRVRIRGKLARADRRLWGNEELEIDWPPPPVPLQVEGPRLLVLHRDDDWLVVDKPPGHPVEPEHDVASIVELAACQLSGIDVAGEPYPGVTHRLDRDTSGCLALALTERGLASLSAAFESRRVEKRYLALVLGEPPDMGHLETPYARLPGDSRRYTTKVPSARRAELLFEVRRRLGGAALLEVTLLTGRTHQIRVQLSEAGFPVLGDRLYGARAALEHPRALAVGRLALHAHRLRVLDEAGAERAAATAPLPPDMGAGVGD